MGNVERGLHCRDVTSLGLAGTGQKEWRRHHDHIQHFDISHLRTWPGRWLLYFEKWGPLYTEHALVKFAEPFNSTRPEMASFICLRSYPKILKFLIISEILKSFRLFINTVSILSMIDSDSIGLLLRTPGLAYSGLWGNGLARAPSAASITWCPQNLRTASFARFSLRCLSLYHHSANSAVLLGCWDGYAGSPHGNIKLVH